MKIFSFSILTFLVALLISCSPKIKLPAWSPVGSYDYTVEDTPMGNITGTLVIAKIGDTYDVKMLSPQGKLNMKDPKIADKKIMGTFEFDGTPMEFEGTFEGDMIKGVILSSFGNFPLTGTKKNP